MREPAVCSWSLQPQCAQTLVERMRAAGISRVQLALDPIRAGEWPAAQTTAVLADAAVEIVSGMMAMRGEDYSTLASIRATGGVRLDAHWAENLSAAHANAALAQRLGLRLVTLHAGFLPHDRGDPLRSVMLERLRAIVDAFAMHGVAIALETGQETAETLLDVLDALGRPTVGVNFDPANMILYGMGDPIDALRRLLPWVRQVHVKDACAATTPGEWGTEMPVGEGEVDWSRLFAVLRAGGFDADLVIEREGGQRRVADVATAAQLIRRFAAAG